MAEAYRRVHNFEAARKVLQRAQREHPRSAAVWKALGNLELEAQLFDAAVGAFRIGAKEAVEWFTEGRPATAEEIAAARPGLQ